MIGPLDVIGGMVRDEEAHGENEREANDRQGDAPARKMPPEEEIGSGGEKPKKAERVREEHEGDEREGGKLESGAAAPDKGEAKAGQCDG